MSEDKSVSSRLKEVAAVIVALGLIITSSKAFFSALKNEKNADVAYKTLAQKVNQVAERLSYVEGRMDASVRRENTARAHNVVLLRVNDAATEATSPKVELLPETLDLLNSKLAE